MCVTIYTHTEIALCAKWNLHDLIFIWNPSVITNDWTIMEIRWWNGVKMVKVKISAMNPYLGYIILYGVEEHFSHIYFTDAATVEVVTNQRQFIGVLSQCQCNCLISCQADEWLDDWFSSVMRHTDTRLMRHQRGRSLRNTAPEDCNQRRRLSHSGLRVAATNQIH